MGLLLLLVAGVIALSTLASRPTRCKIAVDGENRAVLVKAFSTVNVRDFNGETVGTLKRVLGQPKVVDTVEGHTIDVLKT